MGNASEPYQRRALHPCRTGLLLIIAHIADPEVETGYADPSILPRRAQVSQFRPTARAHQHRAPPAREPTQNRCEDRQPRPLAKSIAPRSSRLRKNSAFGENRPEVSSKPEIRPGDINGLP